MRVVVIGSDESSAPPETPPRWRWENDEVLVFASAEWFGAWDSAHLADFLERVFTLREVESVEVDRRDGEARIHFYEDYGLPHELLRRLAGALSREHPQGPELSRGLLGHMPGAVLRLRFYRYGRVVSIWERRVEAYGYLRLRHALVWGRPHLVRALQDALRRLVGVTHFQVRGWAGTVAAHFDPTKIHPQQIVHALDLALDQTPDGTDGTLERWDLPFSTGSLVVAGTASLAQPAWIPVGTAMMMVTAIPSYRRAARVVFRERRLGVDVLDSVIFTACYFTGQIFAGAMTAFFLSVGRTLLRQTRSRSVQLITDAFGRQPSLVRRIGPDGSAVEISFEQVQAGDEVLVRTGEVMPVDGVVLSGEAMLDQQALTGEAAPVERGPEDKVMASTLVVAGELRVRVEQAGRDSIAGKIGEVLQNAVGYQLAAQSRGEALADKAVVPTLGLSTLAGATLGLNSALAITNSDLGCGIRMAAPLALLASLISSAKQGVLIKDGRALEMMRQVDTVVFDKTGTLTRTVPEVGEIFCLPGLAKRRLLRLAAAAEQHFAHPIAKAIVEHHQRGGQPLPPVDASSYQVGFGLSVAVDGHHVQIGSRRFMARENLAFPPELESATAPLREAGHSLIYVAIDGEPGGIIELRPSRRTEAEGVIQGLRQRGLRNLMILSGDHEAPTRQLAERLGMDGYFAEVLPQDKAATIERLQAEGRTVCFVGDGINDAIALKKADVSVSLQGATGIATDAAQVLFLEESLARLCTVLDISHALERNVQRSWRLIWVPNAICVSGVFLLGFNIWHSVFFNNLSAFLALGNALLPLRRASLAPPAQPNPSAP